MQQAVIISTIIGFILVFLYLLITRIAGYKIAVIVSILVFICGEFIIYRYVKGYFNVVDYGYGSYEYRRKYSSILLVFEGVSAISTYLLYHAIGRIYKTIRKG